MSGVLLVLLGLWGGLIPLVGPYVHYAYTPNHVWTITSGRVFLEILPAGGTLLGGLILLVSKLRPSALFGASLAAASGAWFAIGTWLAPLWTSKLPAEGIPVGGQIARAMEEIGFFAGLGVVIVCIAAVALGRLSLVTLRDRGTIRRPETTAAAATTATTAGADSAPTGRWPGPRAITMRRVASSGRKQSSAEASDSSATVASTSSNR
jgi:hypothetical protein